MAIPGFRGPCTSIVVEDQQGEHDITLIFTLLICSAIRNCLFPNSKQKAISMLLAFGMKLSDEYKMDRIVPYLILLLNDDHALVRANALIAITQLVL